MTTPSRRQVLAALGAAALAGCASGDAGGDDAATTAEAAGDGAAAASAASTPAVGTAEGPYPFPTTDDRLPLLMSPERLGRESMSGGPSKDGIPSVDDPKFVAADAVDFLADDDVVFGVVRDDEAKAYPRRILVHHEITNDVLAGDPVAVTYCPLTGTVQGFERGPTTFGVSGRLINNNLVMYDRATETWWPQIPATSVPGPWNGDPPIRSLSEFRLIWTTWRRWRRRHPETAVLSTDTGYARNYNRDPYGARGYYDSDALLFPSLDWADRYAPKRTVMGARTPDGAVAFLKDALRTKEVMTGRLGETPVTAVYDPRYDTAYVYLNPEGAAFEFDRGSVVGPDGAEHAPDSLPLDRVHTFDAMWFAWSGYYPEGNVYE